MKTDFEKISWAVFKVGATGGNREPQKIVEEFFVFCFFK